MPPFPKPRTRFSYDVATERRWLLAHRDRRGMPARGGDRLMIGSWNIANFGLQLRREDDLRLMATMAKWFDVLAIQECREHFGDLYQLLHYMGPRYRVVMSDPGGNGERMVFVWDDRRVELLDEVGEVTVPPAMQRHIRLPGVEQVFTGFDRPPYLAGFRVRGTSLSVQVLNVHSYFGSNSVADVGRRALETAAVARWAALRRESIYAGARELIAIGDFNMPKPKRDGGNVVYDAITSRGLVLPGHSGLIGSSVATDNRYDQVAMFPSTVLGRSVEVGVFDFDAVVFKELWDRGDPAVFNAYLRYFLSDHRVMWVALYAPQGSS
jgi:hypothetical protein